MTLAIVLAAGTPAAGLTTATGEPLADRLADQLRRAGADEVRFAATLDELAALADAATGPLLITGTDLVAHTAVLRHLATSPVGPTVALVLTDPPVPGRTAVREERGQVVDAGPLDALDGDATGVFGGALRVGVDDRPTLAAAARAAAVAGPGSAVDRLFAGLAALGTLIFAQRVRLLVAHRVDDDAGLVAAEAAVTAVDEDRAELRLSVKEKDDFFSTYFVSTWSPYLVRVAARLRLTPTGVTVISVLFALAAAVLFGVGGRLALVSGAVLLYLGFVLDCVDGQLARYTRNFSAWGGWLDTMADRAKEYLVYAGLGFGVSHAGLGNGWALAIAAMTLQTVRHMTDTWYGVLHDEAARRPRPTAGVSGGIGDRLNAASTRVQADTGSLSYWLKRTVVFPIGERWALIALTVALFNPLVSLIAVLVWGALAFAYTGALRTLRARWMWVPVLDTVDATLHRDDGPLVRRLPVVRPMGPLTLSVIAALGPAALLVAALWSDTPDGLRWAVPVALLVLLAGGLGAGAAHNGPLDWLVPAALRAAEYLFAIAVGVVGDAPGWLIFGYVFVLTVHHYDLTARLEKRQAAPPLHAATLGWDGRSVLLTLVAIAGIVSIGMATLGAYLLVVFVASVVLAWFVRPSRGARASAAPVGAGGAVPR
ncbi:CDP-alcohol phosphatidyltransferase family protein [Micromonospora orduensis]|uniref:CDP-alcohol phosphatidyltransferase family protein n=1 Tax=Micromonospora orduensis TaxID=1420891 RepID=A0A5C4QVJ4_9ACTN|nr:CDP-alcohol phosphatidyltransferase family protein [Micromonospora orduensis]